MKCRDHSETCAVPFASFARCSSCRGRTLHWPLHLSQRDGSATAPRRPQSHAPALARCSAAAPPASRSASRCCAPASHTVSQVGAISRAKRCRQHRWLVQGRVTLRQCSDVGLAKTVQRGPALPMNGSHSSPASKRQALGTCPNDGTLTHSCCWSSYVLPQARSTARGPAGNRSRRGWLQGLRRRGQTTFRLAPLACAAAGRGALCFSSNNTHAGFWCQRPTRWHPSHRESHSSPPARSPAATCSAECCQGSPHPRPHSAALAAEPAQARRAHEHRAHPPIKLIDLPSCVQRTANHDQRSSKLHPRHHIRRSGSALRIGYRADNSSCQIAPWIPTGRRAALGRQWKCRAPRVSSHNRPRLCAAT